ncbi:MAG: fibronectin type III domain-containing protein [Actinomycetales bacterium]|nr:fibronectin type III domain-containing protein [Actinomycetales bacterium]
MTPIGLDAQPATSAGQVIAGAVSVSWQGLRSPDETGGSEIARYSVSVFADPSGGSPVGIGCSSVAGPSGPPAPSCVVTGLAIGSTMWFTVTATSRAGLVSAPADRVDATASAVPPGAPQRVAVVEGVGQLRVSWGAPTGDATAAPGQRVTGYTVIAWDSITGGVELGRCATDSSSVAVPATSCTITGLANGTGAYVDVIARNAAGESAASNPRLPGMPRSVPASPINLTVTPGSASLRATWSAPTSTGGWPVSSYAVTAYDAATGGATNARCTVVMASQAIPLTCVLTGLVNGTRVWLSVVATNQAGTSAPSIRVSGVPIVVVPDPPRSVSVQASDNRIQVSWMAPAATGGAPLTGYSATAWSSADATASPVGACTTEAVGSTPPATTCVIDGLLNGDPVWVAVRARNSAGLGSPSTPRVAATPVAVPDAPPAPTVDSGLPGQLMAAWTRPGDDGGLPVLEYRVTVTSSRTGGSAIASCGTTAQVRSCTLSGLTNEVSQWVSVQARNAMGWSEPSARVEGIPQAALPTAPTGAAVTASPGSVRVTWRAPLSNGGSPITGYAATVWSARDAGSRLGSCVVSGSAQACTVTGLVNGEPVYVDIVATTLAGDSPASAPRVGATPRGAPQSPTGVVAQAAFANGRVIPGALAVTWDAPASDGGYAITNYRVQAFTSRDGLVTAGSGCIVVTAAGALQPARSCIVTGLRNDATYYVGVTAGNSGGNSAGSSRDEGTPLAAEPGAPRLVAASVITDALVATSGNGVVSVTWAPPMSDGGLPVTTYTAAAFGASAGEDSLLDTCTVRSSAALACRLDQLPPGEPVFVEVVAANAIGEGEASAPRVQVMPVSLPDIVDAPAVVAGQGSLMVSWTEPDHDGGALISGYTATAYLSEAGSSGVGRTCVTTNAAAPTRNAPTSCVISGLVNGQAYWIGVVARNRVGGSVPSPRSLGVPQATVPGVPRSVTASPSTSAASVTTVGPGTIRVAWQSPLSTGGSPITGYNATAWTGPEASDPSASCAAGPGASNCLITGLDDGRVYEVEVKAANAVGQGNPSAPRVRATPRTYPGWPTVAGVQAGNGRLLVTWEPTSDGGASIVGYSATAYTTDSGFIAASTCSTSAAAGMPPALSCTVEGLANGVRYYIAVAARNSLGNSSAAASPRPARTAAAPVADPPGAPVATSVRVVAGNLAVAWAPPSSNGGALVTGYTATAFASPVAGSGLGSCTTSSLNGGQVPAGCTITGLELGSTVYVSVTARNSSGVGAASTRIAATPAVAPAAPTGVQVRERHRSLVISWAAPAVTGGSPVSAYTARAYATSATALSPRCVTSASPLAPTLMTCTISGLTNGLRYSVDVAAQNSAGYGVPSVPVVAVPTTVTPDAPTALSARPGDGRAIIAFTAGFDGGAAIINYEYSLDDGRTWLALGPQDNASPVTVTGLPNNVTSSIRLRAVNANGAGSASEAVSVRPAPRPATPMDVVGVPMPAGANISFTLGSDFGYPISNMEVQVGSGPWRPMNPARVSGPLAVTGLTDGVTYAIRIRAVNIIGVSDPTEAVSVTAGEYAMPPDISSPTMQSWLVNSVNNHVVYPARSSIDYWNGVGVFGCLVDTGGTVIRDYRYTYRLYENGVLVDSGSNTGDPWWNGRRVSKTEPYWTGLSLRACGTPPTPPYLDPAPGWWSGIPTSFRGTGGPHWIPDEMAKTRPDVYPYGLFPNRVYTIVVEITNDGVTSMNRVSFRTVRQ